MFQNKFYPKLNLHNNHLEYQVLKTKSAEYSQIKWVRGTFYPYDYQMQIVFSDRRQTLIAYLPNAKTFRTWMDFLLSKGIQLEIKAQLSSGGFQFSQKTPASRRPSI